MMEKLPFQDFWLKALLLTVSVAAALSITAGFLHSVREVWAAGGEVFTVNNVSNTSDFTPGDCICLNLSGYCTLRAAIEEANACSGNQTIKFLGQYHIDVTSALPALTDGGTVIDGSERWHTDGGTYPGVVLDGNGGSYNGLEITSDKNAVYGVQVIRFGKHGIYLHGETHENTIGGAFNEFETNIISANGLDGVLITGTQATSNTVIFNFVGLNPLGLDKSFGEITNWGNANHGISVWSGESNQISDNLVGGNGWSGITVDQANKVRVFNNYIGLGVYQSPAPNVFYGVHNAHGGSSSILSNHIAYNLRGIKVESGSYPIIQGNTIYSNSIQFDADSYGGGILVDGSDSTPMIRENNILSNTARYGGGIAAVNGAQIWVISNTIRANGIISGGYLVGGGAGIYVDDASAIIRDNQVLSNTLSGQLSGSILEGGGIYLHDATGAEVNGNLIAGNQVHGNAGGGGGISVWRGTKVVIQNNRVWDNQAYSYSYNGSGIMINSLDATSNLLLDRNWIACNRLGYGAVAILNSEKATLNNNLIVDNDDTGLYLLTSLGNISGTHNTIARNNGDGIRLNDSQMHLHNTIVASNADYGVNASGSYIFWQIRNDLWGNLYGNSNVSFPFYMTLDPKFNDPLNGDYTLQLGSPCLDAAHLSYSLPFAFGGTPRPQGPGPDIGAYELVFRYLPLARK